MAELLYSQHSENQGNDTSNDNEDPSNKDSEKSSDQNNEDIVDADFEEVKK